MKGVQTNKSNLTQSAQNTTICFFNSSKDWGGGEKWHFEMASYLQSQGYKVIVCCYPGSVLHEKAVKSSVTVRNYKISNSSFLNPFLIKKLKSFFVKEGISHLIINLPSDLKAAGMAAHKASVPRIIYRRGSAKPIKNSMFNRYLFKNIIHLIITNSEETKKTILQNNKDIFPKHKIKVIYNGIQVKDYDSSIKIMNPNNIVIGTAGRLSKEKGHSRILDVALLLKKRGLPFTLKIAGTGPEEKNLKEKTKNLELKKYIHFVGFIDPFKSFLKDIDIFVLPSYYEGFGYVLIEAMAAEKPVLSFDIGAAQEIIAHEKNGYIISNDDLESMAKKIETLAHKPELHKQFGSKGRQIVQEKFSSEKMHELFILTTGL